MAIGDIYLAQTSVPYDSGLPADVSINTFHFKAIDGPGTNFPNIRDMLQDFYTGSVEGQLQNLMHYYSTEMSSPMRLRIYNLSDAIPRAIVYEDTWDWIPNTGINPMPAEVAFVSSFQAEVESGSPQARRRGRVYLGPLNQGAGTGDGSAGATLVRPHAEFISDVALATEGLADAADASVTYDWVVYSRVGDTAAKVVSGWVDDAWDTQRRRGNEPTSRESWAIG